jgi:hypothetical protein
MTEAHVAQAVQALQATGQVVSSRNINRLLRRQGPRYMGASYRDLLPLLRWYRLPREARDAIRALAEITTQAEVLAAAGGRSSLLLVHGEQAKDRVTALMTQAVAAGQPVGVFREALEGWSQASSRLIWGRAGRPW